MVTGNQPYGSADCCSGNGVFRGDPQYLDEMMHDVLLKPDQASTFYYYLIYFLFSDLLPYVSLNMYVFFLQEDP